MINPFSIFKQRLGSFIHAFRGGATLLKTQHNARLHLAATCGVIVAGLVVKVSAIEWLALAVVMALVWIAEAFNTAIEFLGDEITLERRDLIGKAKDLAAFGVLVAAFLAAITGCYILVPKLFVLVCRMIGG